MENVTDALYMAAAILIFVVALTVSMSSFTTMRTQIDDIVEMDERIDLARDENNYLNYKTTSSDIRTVGIETVVSSMYRVAKENYVIYIKAKNLTLPDGVETTLSEIASDSGKIFDEQSFPDGEDPIEVSDDIIYIDINENNSDIDVLLNDNGVYEALKDKKFKEYLGVYQEKSAVGVDDSNKITYRVITYVEVT